MKDNGSINDHFDKFNKTIMNLRNVDIKIDDESQIINFDMFPINFFFYNDKHFVDTITYDRDTLSIEDVKIGLNSKKVEEKCI